MRVRRWRIPIDHAQLGGTATTVAVVPLGLVWTFSGLLKFLDLSAFESVVLAHGVIGKPRRELLWLVPLIEMSVGWLLACYGGSRVHGRTGWAISATSVVLLGGLTAYILMVPRAVLQAAGCGCHGSIGAALTEALPADIRLTLLCTNAALAALHWPLLRIPREPTTAPESASTT
ncbi:MAG: hypothetical protein KIT68_10470 [Phycisphaeraceae bacterium]|nr:hypothetical protein [Phycisphaeraceae bacterium]